MSIFAHALLPLWVALALLAGDGWLGIYLADAERPTIAEVVPDSPAERAGLRPGDVIASVDDEAVDTVEALFDRIGALDAGTSVKLGIERGDRELDIVVVLGERPADAAPPQRPVGPSRPAERPAAPAPETAPARPWLGLVLRATDDGLLVEQVEQGGPAADTDLQKGDRLLAIGDSPVPDFDALDRALARLSAGQTASLRIARGGEERSVAVQVGSRPARAASVLRVQTTYPGAQAEAVEERVTAVLGDALARVAGVRAMRSDTRDGVSTITLELEPGRDATAVAEDVRGTLAEVAETLPSGVSPPRIVADPMPGDRRAERATAREGLPAVDRVRQELSRLRDQHAQMERRLQALADRIDALERTLERIERDG